jgi:hypothetical protein
LVRPTDKTDRRVKRISVRFLSHLAAVVLGFVIAYFLFPRLLIVPVDPATGRPLFERMQTQPSEAAPQSPQNPQGGK